MGLLDLLNGTDGTASIDPAAAALGATGDAVPGLWARLSSLGANLQNINDGGTRSTTLPGASGGSSGSSKGPNLQLYKLGQAMGLKGNDLLTYISNPEKWAENQASLQGYHDAPQGSTAFFGNPLTNPSAAVHINQTGQRDGQGYSVDGQGAITYGGQLPMSDADTTARMQAQTAASLAPSEIQLRLANAAKAGYLNVPQTDNLVQLPGMGGGPAPTPGSAVGQMTQGYTGPGATLGDRNNNPFNVKTPPQGMWQGQVGTDAQGHAIFSDPSFGLRAGDMNLQAYAKHGITTPEAFVDRYVGPDAAPQVKANYTNAIRQAVGDNFDLTQPATRQAIMPAIFHSEGTHTPLPPASGGSVATPVGGPRVVMAAQGGNADDPAFSPDTVQQLAEGFVRTGQLPPLGMGKSATANRVAILNKAGEIQKAGGVDGYDAVSGRTAYKADAASLVKNTQLHGIMAPAGQAALNTLDQAIAFAQKTGAAAPNVPFLAGAIQSGRLNGLHDPNVTAYKNLLETASNEYAKVISGSTGSTGITDGARREAAGRLNEGMTLDQLKAARQSLAAEIAAKTGSIENEIAATRARLQGGNQVRPTTNQQLIQQSQGARPVPAPVVIDFRTGRPVQ